MDLESCAISLFRENLSKREKQKLIYIMNKDISFYLIINKNMSF